MTGTMARGILNVTVVPFPGALSISIFPPWARSMDSTIGRPMPVPSSLVVKKGSKSLSMQSPGMPCPVSLNWI